MSWNTSLRCTEQVRALFTGVRGIRILGSSDAGSCIEHPPSASSSDLLGNGEMLVMRTIERPADPLGELVGPQKPVELHDPPFPVYPLGLDGVQPRTLLRKKATHDPHPTAAVFDLPVVFSEPSPEFLGDVPARVVPDEHQHFLARRLELFGAPRKEPRRYTAHGPAVDEPQPHLAADLGQVEPVAGDRFGIGVVLGDRLLDHTMGLSPLGEAAEGRQGHPAPPALVLKAYGPLRVPVGHLHRSVASEASLFSFVEGVGGGDPSLGPLPAYPEPPRKSRPDGPPRDPPLGEPLLEGNLRRHRERPQAPPAAELPRRAVEQPPQGFGALLVEGVPCSLRPRGFGRQSGKATLVEVVDGIARRLRAAPQRAGYLRGALAPLAGEDDLGPAHDESVLGA